MPAEHPEQEKMKSIECILGYLSNKVHYMKRKVVDFKKLITAAIIIYVNEYRPLVYFTDLILVETDIYYPGPINCGHHAFMCGSLEKSVHPKEMF